MRCARESGNSAAVPSVLIVDDRRLHAEALAFHLRRPLRAAPVATAGLDAAASALARTSADVVLVDIDAMREDEIELLSSLAGEGAALVVLSDGLDAASLVAAVRAGARAIVLKSQPIEHLVSVLHGVVASEMHIPPTLLAGIIDRLVAAPSRNRWHLLIDRLTERELDVLRHMVAGRRRSEIAREMFVSVNTVRTHARNILAKLEVHSSVEAVGVALRAGLGRSAEVREVP